MANRSEHFYAVVRVDLYDGVTLDEIREHATNYVTIKEVLPTQEEAEREVQRLTALNADKQCVYFAQVTQFSATDATFKSATECQDSLAPASANDARATTAARS